MRKQYYASICVAVTILLTGCATYRVDYDIGLYEVERPAQARERYGEQKITKVQEENIEKYYFEDEMVQIAWIPIASRISFVLTNKTDYSIKIVWDEAAFVDTNGMSHRVMHSGVKYIDRNNPQPPSVIVRRGAITDDIIPSDNVYYASGDFGGWREEPLLPNSGTDARALKTKAEKYSGKTYQVLLPLEIEGIINEYIFTFKINNVEVAAAQNAEAGEVSPKKVPLKQSLKSAGIFFGAVATALLVMVIVATK
ncbi:hypothetical protein FJZ31_08005 [Candidatus Poribacteria bacterium]|nr:hypothetical protein [Candidatus Poribacteria bacterium]